MIHALLREFSPQARTSALVVSLIKEKCGPLSPLIAMSAAISVMAQYLCEDHQIALADHLRDVADHVEHRREVMTVD
jgi:uroporphyrinogen-III decarboxylase